MSTLDVLIAENIIGNKILKSQEAEKHGQELLAGLRTTSITTIEQIQKNDLESTQNILVDMQASVERMNKMMDMEEQFKKDKQMVQDNINAYIPTLKDTISKVDLKVEDMVQTSATSSEATAKILEELTSAREKSDELAAKMTSQLEKTKVEFEAIAKK
jgi:hypothetical protein